MMFFAAVHEPAFGMKRRFVVLHQFGGYWKHSGYSASVAGVPMRRE
jgi:hypothetical protein